MPFLIAALVGFLVLPIGALAPIPVDAASADPVIEVATTTPVVAVPVNMKNAGASFTVKLTGYNAVPAQTDANPFTTASGAFSNPEVVAARSSDLARSLPFGTIIAIERTTDDTPWCNFQKVSPQIGYRVIADSMNTRITNTVDVLFDQHNTVPVNGRNVNPGIALGMCGHVSVRVIGRIAVDDIPDTQEQLAAIVEQNSSLALR